MKKFGKGLGAVLLMSVLIAGCGNDQTKEKTDATDQTVEVTGESLYTDKCSTCHGANLKGNGKDLNTIKERMTKDEVKAQIKNGAGTMPAGLLDDVDTELVTDWLFSK